MARSLIDSVLERKVTRLALIGLAKNSGKTTALNHLIAHASTRGMALGLTSSGRDGEPFDLVTDLPKPRIWVPAGTIVATTRWCMDRSTANYRLIRKTSFRNPLGTVNMYGITKAGLVELAGPGTLSALSSLTRWMRSMGADLIIIDGACDRKTAASPIAADGVVLSTGAVLSSEMRVTLSRTKHWLDILTLPRTLPRALPLAYLHKRNVVLYNGALTGDTLVQLRDANPGMPLDLVVKDPTCVFLEPGEYRKMQEWGWTLAVLNPVDVVGVTLNPTSPYGYGYDPFEFRELARKALAPVPVFDIVSDSPGGIGRCAGLPNSAGPGGNKPCEAMSAN